MKIRIGFVSNSSACSFMCDISGNAYHGYDWDIERMGICGCTNKHIFEKKYACHKEELEKYIINEKVREKTEKGYFYSQVDLPTKFCPICNMVEFSEHVLVRYLKKEHAQFLEDIKNKIKNKYHSYQEFLEDTGIKEESFNKIEEYN